MFYCNAQPYKDVVTLIIRNGPSGLDISVKLSRVAAMVYHSFGGAPSQDDGVGKSDWRAFMSRGRCGGAVTRRAGVDRARSLGRSGLTFGRTWLQRAGRCANSSFVSGF